MNAAELLARIYAVTSWKVGDRVQDRWGNVGTVVLVQNANGSLDGVQMLGIDLDNGTTLMSFGGEVDAA
jgi:hypothetical protein